MPLALAVDGFCEVLLALPEARVVRTVGSAACTDAAVRVVFDALGILGTVGWSGFLTLDVARPAAGAKTCINGIIIIGN